MKYHKFRIAIDGTAFASDEDVQNYINEVKANGGSCTEEEAAKGIIAEQINDLFDNDEVMKLNEIIYVDIAS